MSKNKTEQTAQRLVDQFVKTNDLLQFVNDTCDATAHYARLSGSIRHMFQEELLRIMKGAAMESAQTATPANEAVRKAALDFVGAFGGDVPGWIRPEYDRLVSLLQGNPPADDHQHEPA